MILVRCSSPTKRTKKKEQKNRCTLVRFSPPPQKRMGEKRTKKSQMNWFASPKTKNEQKNEPQINLLIFWSGVRHPPKKTNKK